MIINKGITLLDNIDVFNDIINTWIKNPTPGKTWEKLKSHFQADHHDLKNDNYYQPKWLKRHNVQGVYHNHQQIDPIDTRPCWKIDRNIHRGPIR